MKRKILTIMLVGLFFTMLPYTPDVSATELDDIQINSIDQGYVYPDGKTVEEVIAETYSESLVYGILNGNKYIPDDYWIDASLYVLEFTISDTDKFLSGLSSVATNGITADMFGIYPNIYIPIFGGYDDGTVRIIGHVKIYYTCGKTECWGKPTLKNALSEQFISGESKHFLEEIDAFNGYNCVAKSLGLSNVSRPILLCYPMSPNSGEKLLLVAERNNVHIYDFMNTVHSAEETKQPVMTVNQYVAQRSEYEQKLQSSELAFGGIGVAPETLPKEQAGTWGAWCGIIPIILCSVAVIIFCIYRNKKKIHKPSTDITEK